MTSIDIHCLIFLGHACVVALNAINILNVLYRYPQIAIRNRAGLAISRLISRVIKYKLRKNILEIL